MLSLLLSVTGFCFAQNPPLFKVVTNVKPYVLKLNDFEKSVKSHVVKYHTEKNPMYTYEIISGERTGEFFYVLPQTGWKDLDNPRADLAQHDMDYNTTVQSKVESVGATEYWRYVDSLSHSTDGNFTCFIFNFYYVKPGKLDDALAEIKRGVLVNNKNKSTSNYRTYVKQLAGINPVIAIVSAFKDGFAQLEPDYMAPNNKMFKDTYIEMNGQNMWDKRMVLLPITVDKVETELVKLREDLSTKVNN